VLILKGLRVRFLVVFFNVNSKELNPGWLFDPIKENEFGGNKARNLAVFGAPERKNAADKPQLKKFRTLTC